MPYTGVDKLPDYLWSDTKDVNQRQKNLLSLTAVNYAKIIDPEVNGEFYSIKTSFAIIYYISFSIRFLCCAIAAGFSVSFFFLIFLLIL